MSVVGHNANIAEALDYTLNALVLTGAPRIAQRNLAFEPAVGENYLRPSFLPARGDYAAVGRNLRRLFGLYQIDVVGPTNTSAVPQDQLADLLIEAFAGQNITRNGYVIHVGISTGGSGGSLPYVSPQLVADGWRAVPVTVPWWCDVLTTS